MLLLGLGLEHGTAKRQIPSQFEHPGRSRASEVLLDQVGGERPPR
jgi:hypothetical protein